MRREALHERADVLEYYEKEAWRASGKCGASATRRTRHPTVAGFDGREAVQASSK